MTALATSHTQCQGVTHTSSQTTKTQKITPSISLASSEHGWSLWAELPHVKQEEISLNTEGQTLILEAPSSKGQYYRKLKFPNSVDWDQTKADWKEGLLHIHVPLTQVIKKNIKIQTV